MCQIDIKLRLKEIITVGLKFKRIGVYIKSDNKIRLIKFLVCAGF